MLKHTSKLWLILFPFLEFISLRFFLHYQQGVRIGYRNMTDKDVVFPSLFAFLILLIVLEQRKPLVLTLRKKTAVLHVLLFGLAWGAASHFEILRSLYLQKFVAAWLIVVFFTFVTGVFSWISPRYLFGYPNRELYISIYLLVASKFLATHAFSLLAAPFQELTAQGTVLLSSLFSSDVKMQLLKSGSQQFVQVAHPLHVISVGVGCNGLEGISLLLFTLLVTWALNPARFSVAHWMVLCISGSAFMAFVNILRLVFVFFLPIVLVSLMGPLSLSLKVRLVQFHDVLGWLSYLLGVFFFYRLAIRDFSFSNLFAAKHKQARLEN